MHTAYVFEKYDTSGKRTHMVKRRDDGTHAVKKMGKFEQEKIGHIICYLLIPVGIGHIFLAL